MIEGLESLKPSSRFVHDNRLFIISQGKKEINRLFKKNEKYKSKTTK